MHDIPRDTAKWGFPITSESGVRKNGRVVGRFSEFETTTFYWSSGSGAFEVHGDIRRKYMDLGGPRGELGFPLSDEKVTFVVDVWDSGPGGDDRLGKYTKVLDMTSGTERRAPGLGPTP
jgi:uncharacterized protein with LGFP repeats